jgi:hypothetical protein
MNVGKPRHCNKRRKISQYGKDADSTLFLGKKYGFVRTEDRRQINHRALRARMFSPPPLRVRGQGKLQLNGFALLNRRAPASVFHPLFF